MIPGTAAAELTTIDIDGGGGVDAEFPGRLDVFGDSSIGFFSVDAACELKDIDPVLGSPGHQFAAERFQAEGCLFFEDPVVEFPVIVFALQQGAAAGDGGGAGPGMDLFQREVVDEHADLFGESFKKVCAENFGLIATVGALVIGVDGDDDGCAECAEGGLPDVEDQTVFADKRVGGGVENVTTDDGLAVGGNDVLLFDEAFTERSFDGDFLKAFQEAGGLFVGDLELDFRGPEIEMAEEGFKLNGVELGLFDRFGLGWLLCGLAGKCYRQKAHENETHAYSLKDWADSPGDELFVAEFFGTGLFAGSDA